MWTQRKSLRELRRGGLCAGDERVDALHHQLAVLHLPRERIEGRPLQTDGLALLRAYVDLSHEMSDGLLSPAVTEWVRALTDRP